MTHNWKNWGRTEQSHPSSIVHPRSAHEISATVMHARETGQTVRPIGAGHSFSGIAATEGIQLSLRRVRGIAGLDLARAQVTFFAGTYLWEIPGLLGPYGLALQNMGDIDRQTIAGAISTGTHGTGARFGSLSTQVTGATFVSGTGEICTVSSEDEQLSGLALSLGALGVFVTITVQCVPEYLLHAVEKLEPLENVLETFSSRNAEHDHFEFYWFPHTSVVRTKSNSRVLRDISEPQPQHPFQRFMDTEVANNLALGGLVALQHRFPIVTPSINSKVSGVSSTREYRDYWNRVLVTRRRVRFREMEYALPSDAVPMAVRELNQQIEKQRLTVSFPVEVRSAAADTLWLSPTIGRDTGYVAVHRYWKETDTAYFTLAEQIFRNHGGVPHWGKLHTLGHEDYEMLLPNFERFHMLRDDLDPDRVFENSYLYMVLGA